MKFSQPDQSAEGEDYIDLTQRPELELFPFFFFFPHQLTRKVPSLERLVTRKPEGIAESGFGHELRLLNT